MIKTHLSLFTICCAFLAQMIFSGQILGDTIGINFNNGGATLLGKPLPLFHCYWGSRGSLVYTGSFTVGFERRRCRQLAGRMHITLKRIWEARAGGIDDVHAARDWIEAMSRTDPEPKKPRS